MKLRHDKRRFDDSKIRKQNVTQTQKPLHVDVHHQRHYLTANRFGMKDER